MVPDAAFSVLRPSTFTSSLAIDSQVTSVVELVLRVVVGIRLPRCQVPTTATTAIAEASTSDVSVARVMTLMSRPGGFVVDMILVIGFPVPTTIRRGSDEHHAPDGL